MREIREYLDVPFAFFGHSMGAAIAFELARALRRSGTQMPLALFTSAARAPQFRKNYTPAPDPADSDFFEELRRLEGLPSTVLDQPEALEILMPALRADARLYRRYVYHAEPPLHLPIFTYAGRADPNVRPEHMERWREQTTSRFEHREFEGGHFYLQSSRDEFLAALEADLRLDQAGVTGDSNVSSDSGSGFGSRSLPVRSAPSQAKATEALRQPATTPMVRMGTDCVAILAAVNEIIIVAFIIVSAVEKIRPR